ncbi:MAG: inorganic phosphate transporter [Candidatus Diapherotrites archaeon]
MVDSFILVFFGVAAALIFDFGNGFNDAANAISTVIATRVLSPWKAVLLAAGANFVAAFLFTTAVAATIGKGIIMPGALTEVMIISGLFGAIFWVYLATWLGFPISASHALIGGLVGAALVSAGPSSLVLSGIFMIFIFIFIAPMLGLAAAFLLSALVMRIARHYPLHTVNKYFRKLQLVSVSVYSLGHGTNDAQKTMGVISALLFAGGFLGGEFYVPAWVIFASYGAIALGTLLGGWNVVKTMGFKLTKLKPMDGFCAESAGAATIIGCSLFGIPVSTTHVISGSIVGTGAAHRIKSVRWGIARNMAWAWVFTVPVAMVVGAGVYLVLGPLLG